jgi:hypothetical protein
MQEFKMQGCSNAEFVKLIVSILDSFVSSPQSAPLMGTIRTSNRITYNISKDLFYPLGLEIEHG